MPATQFQPMSIGQILDQAFRIFRQNFVQFVTIVAVVEVPLILLQVLALMGVQPAVAEDGTVHPEAIATRMVVVLISVLLLLIGRGLINAVLLKSVSESYLGNEVSVGQAYGFVWPKLGRIIWASIAYGVVVGVGLLLLVVPGVLFMLWYSLLVPVIVMESMATGAAFKRSKTLVRGNLGKVFLLTFLLAVIGAIAGGLCGGIAAIVAPKSQLTSGLANLIAQILVAPLSSAAMVLLYYDMRIRKEGFDLEMLAKQFGSGEAPADAHTPA